MPHVKNVLQHLFTMFYPLSKAEKAAWARIVGLPEDAYLAELDRRASEHGLNQELIDGSVAWAAADGTVLLLFFRIPNPRDLDAIRRAFDLIAQTECFIAYMFLQQMPDGDGTWDVFVMSRLSYLAHCNRLSGPGSDCEASDCEGGA